MLPQDHSYGKAIDKPQSKQMPVIVVGSKRSAAIATSVDHSYGKAIEKPQSKPMPVIVVGSKQSTAIATSKVAEAVLPHSPVSEGLTIWEPTQMFRMTSLSRFTNQPMWSISTLGEAGYSSFEEAAMEDWMNEEEYNAVNAMSDEARVEKFGFFCANDRIREELEMREETLRDDEELSVATEELCRDLEEQFDLSGWSNRGNTSDVSTHIMTRDEVVGLTAIEDSDFNVEGVFTIPQEPVEPLQHQEPVGHDEISIPFGDQETFQLIVGGSKRGGDIIVSSQGFSYSHYRRSVWRCSKRSQHLPCPAVVVYENSFTPRFPHLHPPEPSLASSLTIKNEIRKAALAERQRGATSIVEDVLKEHHQEVGNLPPPENLRKIISRKRSKLEPPHPTSLDFQVDETVISPNFFKGDITFEVSSVPRRHLIFATDRQIDLLAHAHHWFIDATFKVIRPPFKQLLTIHSFVRVSEECGVSKQVVLAYVLMSSKTAQDYEEVFQTIIVLFGSSADCQIQCATMDFEAAMWKAFRKVFKDVPIKGCNFHWSQAVYRKVQDVGLQAPYNQKSGTVHRYIRQLMALPYLPKEHITPAFLKLAEKAGSEQLKTLTAYIRSTWIETEVWPPACWSVFMRFVRTNNDVEGWHHRLNRKIGSQTPRLYRLIHALHKESETIPLTIRLLEEGRVIRNQKKKYRDINDRLSVMWAKYREGTLSTSQLLQQACYYIAY